MRLIGRTIAYCDIAPHQNCNSVWQVHNNVGGGGGHRSFGLMVLIQFILVYEQALPFAPTTTCRGGRGGDLKPHPASAMLSHVDFMKMRIRAVKARP